MIKNYQIFKETLNAAIQNSGLDIGAVYFILKDALSCTEKLYYAQINRECAKEQKEAEESQTPTRSETENPQKEQQANPYGQ
jgi:hypothetical protein